MNTLPVYALFSVSALTLQMSTERIATKILPTDENLITKKDHMNPDTDVT